MSDEDKARGDEAAWQKGQAIEKSGGAELSARERGLVLLGRMLEPERARATRFCRI